MPKSVNGLVKEPMLNESAKLYIIVREINFSRCRVCNVWYCLPELVVAAVIVSLRLGCGKGYQ